MQTQRLELGNVKHYHEANISNIDNIRNISNVLNIASKLQQTVNTEFELARYQSLCEHRNIKNIQDIQNIQNILDLLCVASKVQ